MADKYEALRASFASASSKGFLAKMASSLTHLQDPTIPIGFRLYLLARHADPVKLATELLAYNTTVPLTIALRHRDGSNTISIPWNYVLVMLLPLVNTKCVQRNEPYVSACKAISLLSKYIAEISSLNPAQQNRNFSYASAWKLVFKALEGAMEELILIVQEEVKQKKGLFGHSALQNLPPFAKDPSANIIKTTSEMTGMFSSISDLLLWVSVANAAYASIYGTLDVQRLLINCVASDNAALGKIQALFVPTQVYSRHQQFITIDLLFHNLCVLFAGKPTGQDAEAWRAVLEELLVAICISRAPNTSYELKKCVFLALNGIIGDTKVQNDYGIPSVKEFAVTMNEFIHPVFTSRMPSSKHHLRVECNWDYYGWQVLSIIAPAGGSVLAEIIRLFPSTTHRWFVSVGLNLLYEDRFTKYRDFNITEQVAATQLADIFHPYIFAAPDEAVEGSTQLQHVFKSRVFTSHGIANFFDLLKAPVVMDAINANVVAKSFLAEYLPGTVALAPVARDGSHSKPFLLLTQTSLMQLMPQERILQVINEEVERQPDVGSLLSVLRAAPWAAGLTVPLDMPRLKVLPPSKEDAVLSYFLLDFNKTTPFITIVDKKPCFSVVAWAWVSGLAQMDLASQLVGKVQSIDMLKKEAGKAIDSASGHHNALKFSVLFDSIFISSCKERHIDPKAEAYAYAKPVIISIASFAQLQDNLRELMTYVQKKAEWESMEVKALYPYNQKLSVVEGSVIHEMDMIDVIDSERYPMSISRQTLQVAGDHLDKYRSTVAGASAGTKKAFTDLETAIQRAAKKIPEFKKEAERLDRLCVWIANSRSEISAKNDNEAGKAHLTKAYESIQQFTSQIDSLAQSLKAIETLKAADELISAHEDLQKELISDLNPQGVKDVNLLLLRPILEGLPPSSVFQGLVLGHLAKGTPMKEALCDAILSLNEFIARPTPLDDKYITHITVDKELTMLNELQKGRGSAACDSSVEIELKAFHSREVRAYAKKLFSSVGLDPVAEKEWQSKEIAEILSAVPTDAVRMWKTLTLMKGVVKIVQEALKNPVKTDATKEQIEAVYKDGIKSFIDVALARMRGMVSSDASYDILNAFKIIVPIVTALFLTNKNVMFPLAARLRYLGTFTLDQKVTSRKMTMLGDNLGKVISIIETQGAMSEATKVKLMLTDIQRDEHACLAISVRPIANVTPQDYHESADTAYKYHNLSVQLLATNPEDSKSFTVVEADEALVTFEERVVLLGDPEKSKAFSSAWSLVAGLLPQLSHAYWLGLTEDSIALDHTQKEVFKRLPKLSDESFYMFCVSVNSISQSVILTQDKFVGQVQSFISAQAKLSQEQPWLLAFPRRIANSLQEAKKSGAPIFERTIMELEHVATAFGATLQIGLAVEKAKPDENDEDGDGEDTENDDQNKVPEIRLLSDYTFDMLKEAITDTNIYIQSQTKAVVNICHTDIMWCISEFSKTSDATQAPANGPSNGSAENNADDKSFSAVYFGEAIRLAINKYQFKPLPFELFWCSIRTTVHDVGRLIDAMKFFVRRRFTIIGVDALVPSVALDLYRGINELGNNAPAITILTGTDELGFGELRSEIVGCQVLNPKRNGKPLDIPKLPQFKYTNDEKDKYLPDPPQNCTFITGDFMSGKSHYAKRCPDMVQMPHTGDYLDLSLAIDFFRKFKYDQQPKAVWIDINGYMITPTYKDPHRLQKLNHFLWMLLQNRVLVHEGSGASVIISKDTQFLIEVPPHMMFSHSKNAIPPSIVADPTMSLSSCAHLGGIMTTNSKLEFFDVTQRHMLVAAAFELIKSKVGKADWSWEEEADLGAKDNLATRQQKTLSIIAEALKAGGVLAEAKLVRSGTKVDDIVLTSKGRLASLLQLLFSRFRPLLQSPFASEWIIQCHGGIVHCLKQVISQTCVRWVRGCSISRKNLIDGAQRPLFLPSTEVVIPYPASFSVGNYQLQELCDGLMPSRRNAIENVVSAAKSTIESLKKVKTDPANPSEAAQHKIDLEKATSLSGLTLANVELSYVLTGTGTEPDLVDLQTSLDAVGFVTVDDMLVRALHCVERQQSRCPLIIEGGTGVGKSFLLSMMFRVQMQYALRKAQIIVRDFILKEIFTHDLATDAKALEAKILSVGGQSVPSMAFPSLQWFTHSQGEKCMPALYGPDATLADGLMRVFEANKNVNTFFDNFDRMKEIQQREAPVLVWPEEWPKCMVKGTGTRTFGNKVEMVKFFKLLLNTPVDHEYKVVAHPDTRRDDLLKLLEKPVALAKALKQSSDDRINQLVVPVFIDETNTLTETAGLVKTIMYDRRNPLEPDAFTDDDMNIWFVGAINRKSDAYKTQELHPSLEEAVSIFEGISDQEQRRSYIEQTIRKCADFLNEEQFAGLSTQLVDIVLTMHTESDKLSKKNADGSAAQFKHVVSQREFHKVDAVIRTISSLLPPSSNPAVRSMRLVCTCLSAVYYVYIARIRSADMRETMKAMFERMCRGKDSKICPKYIPAECPSIVDAARKEIIESIVTKNSPAAPNGTFTLGTGVALTDTLRENIFLTLLACTSSDKYKLSLAIIGDSGMGKTLSSRVVERNLRGKTSSTEFCQKLPQAQFAYIQGAATTTSEQVSRVCERAQELQIREDQADNKFRSIVSFDEASLAPTEMLVHKALHEPVDRKIISIIVLSNKPFDDEANQNRFLVVWNETLLHEEVQELTAGCLEVNFDRKDRNCPFRPLVFALTASYFELRVKDRQKDKSLATLQMRDYVYLLKFLSGEGHGKAFVPQQLKEGIEMNYGTSSNESLGNILKIFFGNMQKEFEGHVNGEQWQKPNLKPRPVEAIMETSYGRYKLGERMRIRPRFKILIDPSESYGMSDQALNRVKDVMFKNNNEHQLVYVTVSELEGDRRRAFEVKTLSQLRVAMEKGYHVVIRNPERLLSYLFDVLNLNYTTFESADGTLIDRAIVALGAETDFFDVHENFLITFVFSAKTIKRLEATNVPFLSRCEKYLLHIDFNIEFCKPVTQFVSVVGAHNIQMFHPQLTVSSAVKATSRRGEVETSTTMSPEHVFRAVSQIISLMSPPAFLKVCPKFARKAEYTKVYLQQHHFSIADLVRTAEAATCTIACTSDTLSLKFLSKSGELNNHIVIDVGQFRSYEELTAKLKSYDDNRYGRKRAGTAPIIMVISSLQLCKNADFMWTLCNDAMERCMTSSRPYILVTGCPCSVSATFSDRWRYVYLDSCTSSKIALRLLQAFSRNTLTDLNNKNAAEIKPESEEAEAGMSQTSIDDALIDEIVQQFVLSHQPVVYTHYGRLTANTRAEALSACLAVPPIKQALIRMLSEGLIPSKINDLLLSCVQESAEHHVPFMTMLHQKSKDTFLDAARPFLRMVAASPLIDDKIRSDYAPRSKHAAITELIGSFLSYCRDQLKGEAGRIRKDIPGYPERGAFRHPFSPWIFPMVWHCVVNHHCTSNDPYSQITPTNHDARLASIISSSLTPFKGPLFNGIAKLQDQEQRDNMVLDVLQQCGFLPTAAVMAKTAEAAKTYDRAVLKAVREMHATLCGNGPTGSPLKNSGKDDDIDNFYRELLFAGNAAAGPESKRLRQGLMMNIFLSYLEETNATASTTEGSASKPVSKYGNAKTIAESIVKSFNQSNEKSTFGLSLLFSFLFRTQSSATNDNTAALNQDAKKAVIAMLQDLEKTILSGPIPVAQRKKLVSFPAGNLSLKTLDAHIADCGQGICVSALTWYLSGYVDRARENMTKANFDPRGIVGEIVIELQYWISNRSAGTSSTHLRPFFWPVVRILLDALLEVASPLELNTVNGPHRESGFGRTVDACKTLVNALNADKLLADATTLKQVLTTYSSAEVSVPTRLHNMLLDALTRRFADLLKTRESFPDCVNRISKQCEANPPMLVKVALNCSLAVRLADNNDVGAVAEDISRLSINKPLFFYYVAPSPNSPTLDTLPISLLLAYYQRKTSLDSIRAVVKSGSNKIPMFKDFSSSAGSVGRSFLFFYIPLTLRHNENYINVKKTISEGGNVPTTPLNQRFVLHGLREEVFLTQIVDAPYSNAMRNHYTILRAKIAGSWSATALAAFDLLLKPVDEVINDLYTGMGTQRKNGHGSIEGFISPSKENISMPALVTFVMIEIASRISKGENPTNFWDALLRTPTAFKGKPAFGDFLGSLYLIHGFDCGAIYDEITGAKKSPCASIPDLAGQYSLFAVLYTTILSFCLLHPSLGNTTAEQVVTNVLINDSDPNGRYSLNLRAAVAAATACNQHLRFLNQSRNYNSQGISLHLMTTFTRALDIPPPINCHDFAEAERHHSAFGSIVARAAEVNADIMAINKEVADQEWEKQVLITGKALPAFDSPMDEVSHEASKKGEGLLVAFSKVLSVAQTSTRIARAYTALNEVAPKLTPKDLKSKEEDPADPRNLTFTQAMRHAGAANSQVIKDGIAAFNKLLELNGGQLAVECGQEEIKPADENAPIYPYITRAAEDFKEANATELEGLFMHALVSIAGQVPSADTLASNENLTMGKQCIDRIQDFGRKEFVSQSATFWAMYQSGTSDTMRDASLKVLNRLCADVGTNPELANPIQAAISNFFILPTMQIQIEKESLFAPFNFPKEVIDNEESKRLLKSLENEVRNLAMERLKEKKFESCAWPFADVPVETFKGLLNDKLVVSPKLRLDFLRQTKAILESPDLATAAPKILYEASEYTNESVRNAIKSCCPDNGDAGFGFKPKLTTRHLPLLISHMLKESDPYLDNVLLTSNLSSAFCEPLTPAQVEALYMTLVSADGPVSDKIEIAKALREIILNSCGQQDNTTAIFDAINIVGDDEAAALIPETDPLLRLRNAAQVMATIDKVIAVDYEQEHEQLVAEAAAFDLDLPLDKRTVAVVLIEQNSEDEEEEAVNEDAPIDHHDHFVPTGPGELFLVIDQENFVEIVNEDDNESTSSPAPPPQVQSTASTVATTTPTVPATTVNGTEDAHHENWFDMYRHGMRTLLWPKLRLDASSARVGLFTYTTTEPTAFIDRILEDPSTLDRITTSKDMITLVFLRSVDTVAGDNGEKFGHDPLYPLFYIESTQVVLADQVSIPDNHIAFQRLGRVLGVEAVKKSTNHVFLSNHCNHRSVSFTFKMADAKAGEKPVKVAMCHSASVADVTTAIGVKLKGVVLVPTNPLPIPPSVMVGSLKELVVYHKAPTANPAYLCDTKKTPAFEFVDLKGSVTFGGTTVQSSALQDTLGSMNPQKEVPLKEAKKVKYNDDGVLQSWRARQNSDGLIYKFRANLVSPADNTCTLLSITSKSAELTRLELIEAFVRAYPSPSKPILAHDAIFVDVATGLIVDYNRGVVKHTSQIAIYPYEEEEELEIVIEVGQQSFSFFIDATLGTVIATLLRAIPSLKGKTLWWEGVNIFSFSGFTVVRLGRLAMACRKWNPSAMSKVLADLSKEEDGSDVGSVDDYFGGSDVDDEEESEFVAKQPHKLVFDIGGHTNKPSRCVRLMFPTFVDEVYLRIDDKAPNDALISSLIIILSLRLALPPALIGPALQFGSQSTKGLLTVDKRPELIAIDISPDRQRSATMADKFAAGEAEIEQIKEIPVSIFAPATPQLSIISSDDNRLTRTLAAGNPEGHIAIELVAAVSSILSGFSLVCNPPTVIAEGLEK